jgi:plasmanylethanolamine desaturase
MSCPYIIGSVTEPTADLARSPDVTQESPDARDLANGYATGHRLYEYGGILLAIVCASWLALRAAEGTHLSTLALVVAIATGMLFADITSGTVHWLCDTWGSPTTPILGGLAIRTFREHHVDEKAIVRHDFVETNGHNMALSVLPSVVGLMLTQGNPPGSSFLAACLLSSAFFVSITSQVHKWAHMDRPPLVARILQRMRLILPPQHHAAHHRAPHTKNFCITTGWLNRPLHALRFFDTLEEIVTAVTGAVPRGS